MNGTVRAEPLQPGTGNTGDRLAIARFFSSGTLAVWIGTLLLLVLQFQTIPGPIRVQVMPLTSLLAFLFLPFFLRDMPRSPLLTAVGAFLLFTLGHSAIGLFLDMAGGSSETRFIAWLRQAFALLQGAAVFFVMRDALARMTDRRIARVIVVGSLPALALSFLNILWGALSLQGVGAVVAGIRRFIAPLGFTSAFRSSGVSLEPSTFAALIAVIMLPVLFYLLNVERKKFLLAILFAVTVLSFAWTFSLTGLLILLPMMLLGAVKGPSRKLLLTVTAGLAGLIITALTFFPSNQIFRHAGTLLSGKSNVSIADRYYSTFGPFMRMFDSYTMFGYGLGGSSTHFREMLPHGAVAEVQEARWKDMPNLGTMIGRIFAESGGVGLVLFGAIVFFGYRELGDVFRSSAGKERRVFLAAARLGYTGVLIALAVTFGSFHYPYLWFWLALIDSRHIPTYAARREPLAV